MEYKEVRKDLFTVSKDYYIAHCCASDLGLSAGIAVKMQKKFNLRGKIQKSGRTIAHPTCILTKRVFNLITKARSCGKPSYESLQRSLSKMKRIIGVHAIKKVAMPKIGCGLDMLSWPMVREMLKDTFRDIDIEILVCYL